MSCLREVLSPADIAVDCSQGAFPPTDIGAVCLVQAIENEVENKDKEKCSGLGKFGLTIYINMSPDPHMTSCTSTKFSYHQQCQASTYLSIINMSIW